MLTIARLAAGALCCAMRSYMIVERFRPGCMARAYERFRARGRLLPEGLRYIDSWLDREAEVCFQLMETDDPALFAIWFARWDDLVAFDIHPVG